MGGVRSGVRESLMTLLALEWFLSGMNSNVFFEMMLEFERLRALGTLEFSEGLVRRKG